VTDPARIEAVGKITSGETSGWFLYVVHDTIDTGGYFIYTNPSRDFSGEPMFDSWHLDLAGVAAQFEIAGWAVEWLDDAPPSFASCFARPS
jgi:hypothetical protein